MSDNVNLEKMVKIYKAFDVPNTLQNLGEFKF